MRTPTKNRHSWLFLLAGSTLLLGTLLSSPASAQRGGMHRGGGAVHGGAARANAHTSVNRGGGGQIQRNANGNRDINRNHDVNRDVNRNVNRHVDRDVNVNVDYHDDHWNRWDDHPFATAAAVTAGVAVTSAVIGSMVYSIPPSCVTTVINGMAYQQCGNVWYEPRYAGTTVQYVVINAPR